MMFKAIQYMTSCLLSRLVPGVSLITEICGWEVCVLYHSIMSGTPPQPLSIFSPRRHARRRFRNGCFVSDFHCRLSAVYCTAAGPRAAVVSCRLVPTGQLLPTSRDDPEMLDGLPTNPPRSPGYPLSAKAVISLGSAWNGSPRPAAFNPAQDQQPSKSGGKLTQTVCDMPSPNVS